MYAHCYSCNSFMSTVEAQSHESIRARTENEASLQAEFQAGKSACKVVRLHLLIENAIMTWDYNVILDLILNI